LRSQRRGESEGDDECAEQQTEHRGGRRESGAVQREESHSHGPLPFWNSAGV
jgi:hypothetical protein